MKPITLTEAKKKGYLTTTDLARRCGLDRLVITYKASKIPGAIWIEDSKRWVFPESAVMWVSRRIKLSIRI
jgi:hypothetical protein